MKLTSSPSGIGVEGGVNPPGGIRVGITYAVLYFLADATIRL